MGTELKEVKVVASVSRHNSAQDTLDAAGLEHIRQGLERLLEEAQATGAFYSAWVEGP